MRKGIQTFLAEAGEAACYGLDIISIAEEVSGRAIDPISAFFAAIDKGFIHYSWDNAQDPDNFYIDKPEAFLGFLAGGAWTVRKEVPEYQAKPGEFVVQRWERQAVNKTIGHFRRPDWDSLVTSETVHTGKIASLRVFARA
jgi:hypothetical protein